MTDDQFPGGRYQAVNRKASWYVFDCATRSFTGLKCESRAEAERAAANLNEARAVEKRSESRYEAIIDDGAWRVYDRHELRPLGPPPGPTTPPMTQAQCEAAAARVNAAWEGELARRVASRPDGGREPRYVVQPSTFGGFEVWDCLARCQFARGPATLEVAEQRAASGNAAWMAEIRTAGGTPVFERERERGTGRFVHDGHWDRLCVCGHTLGHHTAAVAEGMRPCIECDFDPASTCDCTRFRPQRRRSVVAMRALARRRAYEVAAEFLEQSVKASSPWVTALAQEGVPADEVRDAAEYVAALLRNRSISRQVR